MIALHIIVYLIAVLGVGISCFEIGKSTKSLQILKGMRKLMGDFDERFEAVKALNEGEKLRVLGQLEGRLEAHSEIVNLL